MKHLNGYEILGKTGHCNVYVRPSYDAKVRSVVYHTKPVNKINQIILTSMLELTTFHQIKMQKILPAKSIVDLVMSAKSSTCDVLISNIITRKGNHWYKVQEVNNPLKEVCTNKNIYVVDHSKNIKHEHLNKSK